MSRNPRVDRSPEEKWQIVQEGSKSTNISETCRPQGIAPNLFYLWKDEAEQGAKTALGEEALSLGKFREGRDGWETRDFGVKIAGWKRRRVTAIGGRVAMARDCRKGAPGEGGIQRRSSRNFSYLLPLNHPRQISPAVDFCVGGEA